MKVSITPSLYTRRAKASGKYPVKLKLLFNREKKYYSTGVDLTENEFKNLHLERSLKRASKSVLYFTDKAEKIISDLSYQFSFEEFEKHFFDKPVKKPTDNIYEALKEYKNQLAKEGRLKSRDSYVTTINWLEKFYNDKLKKSRKFPWRNANTIIIPFSAVDKDFLKELEDYMQEKDISISSAGIYLRNIRAVFNKAISDKLISPDLYPFGRNKFTPCSSRNVKKALALEDVEKIFNYDSLIPQELWAKDMWLFSYFSNGLNVKDMALLKFENIKEGEIHFRRQKTRNSRKENQQDIIVYMSDEIKTIIERWGKKNGQPKDYIFDIIKVNKPTDEEIYKAVNQGVKNINKYLKRIAQNIGLSRIPTTNFARHTYSTVMKRAHVPIEMISENLGHSSIRTTQIYLDSFEKEQRKEIVKHLTAFK